MESHHEVHTALAKRSLYTQACTCRRASLLPWNTTSPCFWTSPISQLGFKTPRTVSLGDATSLSGCRRPPHSSGCMRRPACASCRLGWCCMTEALSRPGSCRSPSGCCASRVLGSLAILLTAAASCSVSGMLSSRPSFCPPPPPLLCLSPGASAYLLHIAQGSHVLLLHISRASSSDLLPSLSLLPEPHQLIGPSLSNRGKHGMDGTHLCGHEPAHVTPYPATCMAAAAL